MVETVRGAIAPEALGSVLMHEHLFVLSPEFAANYPEHEGFREDEHVPEAIRRLKELKAGCPKRTSRPCSSTTRGGSWPGVAEPLS
ncbi:hypothetical protein [Amycolatopsis balhimycina]|uniref:phosphotriesterase family protein n=1 Tax=Amycolatopsis balhimycina TaxID=208443 RepID=UPI000382A143|nr:hypothetical protein [Amycolatopsis balhimycina]